jgi:hypothetical protein
MAALLAVALLASGVHGIVMRGPTQPVCQVGKPCSAPAVGAELVFTRGTTAVSVRTGTGGRYSLRLAPGVYTVRVSPMPKIGAGIRPREVSVTRGVFRRVDFEIDTGIR